MSTPITPLLGYTATSFNSSVSVNTTSGTVNIGITFLQSDGSAIPSQGIKQIVAINSPAGKAAAAAAYTALQAGTPMETVVSEYATAIYGVSFPVSAKK